MRTKTFLPAVLGLLAAAVVAVPAVAAGVQFTNSVVRDLESKGPDGRVEHRRVAATGVAPGDKVLYVIAYRNDDTRPIERAVVTNPVPPDLEFVGASGDGEVSVDGGRTYGPLATLSVRTATGTTRPAQAGDVTHVRWRIAGAIAPGAVGEATFEARVK